MVSMEIKHSRQWRWQKGPKISHLRLQLEKDRKHSNGKLPSQRYKLAQINPGNVILIQQQVRQGADKVPQLFQPHMQE